MTDPTPSGAFFGRFRLLGRLGHGGMAEVFRAELVSSAGITKPVVIKRIKRDLFGDEPAMKAMFLEEARLHAQLSHGNIVQVVDAGEIDGEPYIAFEYVPGVALADLLDAAPQLGKRMPHEVAVFIALEMCKALHYAHTRNDAHGQPMNLVHRDVSPQNVMLSYEGEVKLVDFGIAKAYGAPREGREDTQGGIIKGKYVYFSPEQAESKPLDGRSDVYATGAVLYEMLCGRLPFQGGMVEVLGQIVYGKFPRPTQLDGALPLELEAIVLKAMATERTARYPTALGLQEALGSWLAVNAPRMNQGVLINALKIVFRAELEAEGREYRVPLEYAQQVESWPDRLRDSTEITTSRDRPDRTGPVGRQVTAPTAPEVAAATEAPAAPPTVELPLQAEPARGGKTALVVVAALLALLAGGSLALRGMPVAAPPPPADAVRSAVAGPVPGMVCAGAPQSQLAKELERKGRAALDSRAFDDGLLLLERGVATEPTAGALYVLLAQLAAGREAPSPTVLGPLQSWLASCAADPAAPQVERALAQAKNGQRTAPPPDKNGP